MDDEEARITGAFGFLLLWLIYIMHTVIKVVDDVHDFTIDFTQISW